MNDQFGHLTGNQLIVIPFKRRINSHLYLKGLPSVDGICRLAPQDVHRNELAFGEFCSDALSGC